MPAVSVGCARACVLALIQSNGLLLLSRQGWHSDPHGRRYQVVHQVSNQHYNATSGVSYINGVKVSQGDGDGAS